MREGQRAATGAAGRRWPASRGTRAGASPPGTGAFALGSGARGLFTGRPGGCSAGPFAGLNLSAAVGDDPAAVRRNRDLVLDQVAPGPAWLAWLRQVHGARVVYVPGGGWPPGSARAGPGGDGGPPADAMFTDSPEVALGILVADCAPVLLADPAARLVGAAHAGRAGLALGVVPELVAAMTAAGAQPGRIRAVIGPAICGGCYELPAALAARVSAAAPGSACVTRRGTPGVDLRAGLRAQLRRLGVRRVSDDARCTAESAELFSYRRDGTTGRFAGLIWLTA